VSDSELRKQSSKKFTAALIVSVALNIGLLSSLIYIAMTDRDHGSMSDEPIPHVLAKKELPDIAKEEIATYLRKSFRELIALLDDRSEIGPKIKRRDLALSCLVCFHNFHIEKALGGLPFEVRNYSFTNPKGNEQIIITLFPEMTEENFRQIIRFTQTEKWPLTTKGLFLELKTNKAAHSLQEALYLSSEFVKLYKVFERSGMKLDKSELLTLIAEGSWDQIQRIARYTDIEQPQQGVRNTLTHLVQERSSKAATLLVEHESSFLLSSARNEQLSAIIDLLEGNSKEIVAFLSKIQSSIRPEYVKEKAEKKLFFIAQQRAHPNTYRMSEQKTTRGSKEGTTTEIKKQEIEYIVKPGDSLWKISVKYKVPLRTLREKNKLERSEMIRPGQKLIIPWSGLEGTGSAT